MVHPPWRFPTRKRACAPKGDDAIPVRETSWTDGLDGQHRVLTGQKPNSRHAPERNVRDTSSGVMRKLRDVPPARTHVRRMSVTAKTGRIRVVAGCMTGDCCRTSSCVLCPYFQRRHIFILSYLMSVSKLYRAFARSLAAFRDSCGLTVRGWFRRLRAGSGNGCPAPPRDRSHRGPWPSDCPTCDPTEAVRPAESRRNRSTRWWCQWPSKKAHASLLQIVQSWPAPAALHDPSLFRGTDVAVRGCARDRSLASVAKHPDFRHPTVLIGLPLEVDGWRPAGAGSES